MRSLDPISRIIMIRRAISSITYALLLSFLLLYFDSTLHFSGTQIGSLFGVLLIVNQAFSLVAGLLGDRYGAGRMMVVGCFIDATSYLLLAVEPTYVLAFISMIGLGVGGCMFSTNARAALLDIAMNDYKTAARLQGYFINATNLGMFIAPIFSFFLVKYEAYEIGLWVCCGLELLLSCTLLGHREIISYKYMQAPKRLSWKGVRKLLTKQFLMLHLTGMLPYMLAGAFPILIPFIFGKVLGIPEQISLAFFFNGLLMILIQNRASQLLLLKKYMNLCLILCAIFMSGAAVLCLLYPSVSTAYIFLFVFTVAEVIGVTLISNGLIIQEYKENRALTFGLSKLLLAVTSSWLVNYLPSSLDGIYENRALLVEYSWFSLSLFLMVGLAAVFIVQIIRLENRLAVDKEGVRYEA